MDAQSFAMAYALTAAVGVRAFITLALASLAMHFGYLHPAPAFKWMGSDGATAVLAGLAVVEFLAEKVPALDNAVHVLHFATKPVAAALLVGSIVPDNGTVNATTYVLMALGGANAVGVHAAQATVRGASTLTTGGIANPFISIVEDVAAIGGTILSVALPFVAAIVALVLSVVAILIARAIWRAARAPVVAGQNAP